MLEQQGYLALPVPLHRNNTLLLDMEARTLISELAPQAEQTGEAFTLRRLDAYSEYIFDLARSVHLKDCAEDLLGGPVMSIRNAYRHAPMHHCMEAPHQDQAFFDAHFQDELAITFWIPAFGSAPLRMRFATPPGPVGLLLAHESVDDIHETARLTDQSELDMKTVEVSAGECLVHHAFAVHQAVPPYSAFTFTYRESNYLAKLRSTSIHSN